ncbi:MAG: transposase [Pseudonocardiaceae bacterium]
MHGIGPVLAAKILGHTSEITRFPARHHYASYCGTALAVVVRRCE